MTIIITIFNAILCVILLPVRSYYIHADNQNSGYVSLNNAGDNFPLGYSPKQRTYLAYPNSQTYAVNVRETKSESVAPSNHDNWNHKSTASLIPTEVPKKQQKKEEVNYKHDPRNYKTVRGKGVINYKQATMTHPRQEYTPQIKHYDQKINVKGNYDSKGNTVQVNVHKTQIPAEPQKVKLNSNRQLTALSVQRREDNYKKMPTSVLVDKTLQANANIKDRNALIMTRVLDDMTKKVSDRRIKSGDYNKRDIKNSAKRHIVSDSIKKYIGKDVNKAKDVKMAKEIARDAPRIGSREEEIEETNAPYAVFYRMSPESLDNQEGFYLMKSMEDEGEAITFSNKEKRLTVNYQNEVDLKKAKTKKNYNTVRLRTKVKNYSNFRNNNF